MSYLRGSVDAAHHNIQAALDILAQEDCRNEAVPTVQRKRDIPTVVVPLAGIEDCDAFLEARKGESNGHTTESIR